MAFSNSCKQLGSSRDQLILEHLPQVRLIALRVQSRLPRSIPVDDLISAGILGLIAAVDRFSSLHHVKLSTYAEYKIRGAILDALREMDWAPRHQRRRARQVDTAVRELEQHLHRDPTEKEVADRLGIPVSEYQSWIPQLTGLQITSLESSGQTPTAATGESPSDMAELTELRHLMSQAIDQMPPTERTVLQLCYYEELTLREIGRVMGLHESRISQLRAQALQRLRRIIDARPTPEAPTSTPEFCDHAAPKAKRTSRSKALPRQRNDKTKSNPLEIEVADPR